MVSSVKNVTILGIGIFQTEPADSAQFNKFMTSKIEDVNTVLAVTRISMVNFVQYAHTDNIIILQLTHAIHVLLIQSTTPKKWSVNVQKTIPSVLQQGVSNVTCLTISTSTLKHVYLVLKIKSMTLVSINAYPAPLIDLPSMEPCVPHALQIPILMLHSKVVKNVQEAETIINSKIFVTVLIQLHFILAPNVLPAIFQNILTISIKHVKVALSISFTIPKSSHALFVLTVDHISME